jgi:hypothetical protein
MLACKNNNINSKKIYILKRHTNFKRQRLKIYTVEIYKYYCKFL